MSGHARILASLLLAWFGTVGAAVGAQAPAGADPAAQAIDVRTAVSRTAVWVGDRVVYTIELRCAPGVDILLDDLLKERVRIEGGEILSVEPERLEADGRITYRIVNTLVTFRVDATAIHIGPLVVRYYTRGRGERPGDATPAGQVTIPPLTIAVGSTVPVTNDAIQLRRPDGVRPAPAYFRLALPAGLVLVLLASVPAAFSILGLARRARGLQAAYRARQNRSRQRRSFEQIKSLQPASDAERVDAYGQLDEFVRDHLAMTTGLPARSLTPPDLKRALEERAPKLPADAIEAVLEVCERARYAREPPPEAEWAEVVGNAERVLEASRR